METLARKLGIRPVSDPHFGVYMQQVKNELKNAKTTYPAPNCGVFLARYSTRSQRIIAFEALFTQDARVVEGLAEMAGRFGYNLPEVMRFLYKRDGARLTPLDWDKVELVLAHICIDLCSCPDCRL